MTLAQRLFAGWAHDDTPVTPAEARDFILLATCMAMETKLDLLNTLLKSGPTDVLRDVDQTAFGVIAEVGSRYADFDYVSDVANPYGPREGLTWRDMYGAAMEVAYEWARSKGISASRMAKVMRGKES